MVKIAAIQYCASTGGDRVLKKAGQYLEAAAAKGAKIACFPELFAWEWFPSAASDEPFAYAEPLGGPVTSKMAELAATHSIAVVCPFFEKSEDGKYYNSAAVFDASGETVGVYRKMHLPDVEYYEERHYFTPGDGGFPVFEVEGVKLGVQICWDNFFPEGFRALALSGAEVVILPTAAAFASQERWLAMAVSHAIANGIYVIRVNRIGDDGDLHFYGGSFCVRPDGELTTAPLEMKEGILLIDYDPKLLGDSRKAWPFLGDRRPADYAALIK